MSRALSLLGLAALVVAIAGPFAGWAGSGALGVAIWVAALLALAAACFWGAGRVGRR